jgi:hypothetical protein
MLEQAYNGVFEGFMLKGKDDRLAHSFVGKVGKVTFANNASYLLHV